MNERVLITADAVGGVWQYSTDLAAALVPLGYRPILALLGPAPTAEQRAHAARLEGVELIETGFTLDWLASDEATVRATARGVAALARETGAGLLQLNQPALAGEPMPVPAIAVAHSCVATWWRAVRGIEPMPSSFSWQARLMRAGLIAADLVACPTAAFAGALADCYALPKAPRVVHNGRAPIVTSAGALHDFAFTAGRLWDEGKNLATLDQAAARLSVPLKAAGPLVAPHGGSAVFAHLHASGPVSVSWIARCLSARPVFVSAARYEPFGLAVLEAAMAGCPLVLADIPTFRELWGDVATLVPPDDAAGFALAIEELIGDTSRRLAQGDLARRHARRFSPAAMAEAMAALYRELGCAPRTERVAA